MLLWDHIRALVTPEVARCVGTDTVALRDRDAKLLFPTQNRLEGQDEPIRRHGRDDAGALVGAAVYHVGFSAGDVVESRRVVFTR